ncbi:phenylacetate--CoA ligase family protein [Campylobacter mucosalis]|uniref:phenylacetate--CoA ligase family protein n=1 Tax=Campylobacter mucosalis TaxID=202 RepID=UPI0014703AB9|nr:phenylacetate--CoA ligase family protein [Campylobacter mucosalis]
MISKIKNRISNQIFFIRNTKTYDSFQWKNYDEIKNIQTDKLKKILEIAIHSVPFYQKLDIKIDFDNFSLDELKKFPIINKQIMRENFKDFCSTRYNGKLSHTSGSTGIPFEFKIPFESDMIEKLTAGRGWGMTNDYIYKNSDPIVILRTYSPKENEPLYKIIGNYWYLSPFHISDKNLDLYISIIKKSKAKILRGYPSSIYIFTLLLMENNIKLPQIKVLASSSETLLQKYKDTIENYWGVPILDLYGQNERVIMVQQCWAGNYHNNDDYGIVELDGNNIIGTSLNNYVMPFIRYNTGDKAILLDNSNKAICPCGRHLTIPFKGIEGRSDDILIKDDRTAIPSINIYTLMHELDFVKQFQIIQSKNTDIRINIVGELDNNKKALLVECLKNRLGNVKISVDAVDSIIRDLGTGKIKTIVREQ